MKPFDPVAERREALAEHQEDIRLRVSSINRYFNSNPQQHAQLRRDLGQYHQRTGGELNFDQYLAGLVRRYASAKADSYSAIETEKVYPDLVHMAAEEAKASASIQGDRSGQGR